MKRALLILSAGLFAIAACENKQADPKPTDTPAENATTTGASATVATTATAPPTIDEADLSTPADFEETAEKAITKANYKAELASLETDIAKE